MPEIPPIQPPQRSEEAQNTSGFTNPNVTSQAVALLTMQDGLDSILADLHQGKGGGGTTRVSTK